MYMDRPPGEAISPGIFDPFSVLRGLLSRGSSRSLQGTGWEAPSFSRSRGRATALGFLAIPML